MGGMRKLALAKVRNPPKYGSLSIGAELPLLARSWLSRSPMNGSFLDERPNLWR
jgi:hypothetical protein